MKEYETIVRRAIAAMKMAVTAEKLKQVYGVLAELKQEFKNNSINEDRLAYSPNFEPYYLWFMRKTLLIVSQREFLDMVISYRKSKKRGEVVRTA